MPAHYRRVLHQPFFPQHSIPPSPQPPFSNPNQPSSSSTFLPFFPDLPSPPPPPPPPPPVSSSLPDSIPTKSNSGSSKLVAVSVALAVSAVVITVIALFLYLRRRRRDGFNDSKASLSDTSSLRYHDTVGVSGNVLPMPRVSPPNSSEFLYLGTIVNSRGIGFQNGGGGVSDSHTYLRKPDSPELRPLPPLSARSFRKDRVNAELDEEDEEFYSPRGSLGAESASRRSFAAVMVESLTGKSSESSSCSYSSSSSDSPLRSVSLSISPQISLSPESLRPKSPELTAMQNAPSPPLQEPVVTQFNDFPSSPSNEWNQNGHSPVRTGSTFSIPLYSDRNPSSQSLSSSSSPDRPEVKIQYSSLSLVDPPPSPPPPYPSPLSPNHSESSSRPISNFSPLISISPFELLPGSETKEFQTPKLKPLHQDKMRARCDREMVWDQIKSSMVLSESREQGDRSKESSEHCHFTRELNVTIEEVTEAHSEGRFRNRTKNGNLDN